MASSTSRPHGGTNGSSTVNGTTNGENVNGTNTENPPRYENGNTSQSNGSTFSPDQSYAEGRSQPRISLPVELMRDSYDVVVIGTGYGGGVAASRMARGGQKVCVLERGKERWPGEFPENPLDAIKELRVSGELAPGDRRSIPGTLVEGGNPTGLYHFAVGEGQNVYMGNGLGGTSLVNANVFLEATPAVLDMEVWPAELRGKQAWRPYYDRATSILEPAEYPTTFPELAKAKLLQKQASLMGLESNFYRVKQTTRFQDGPNSTGVFMRQSSLTGMDATGINDGSKSTTLVNYLSDAWHWGAEMFCECEVRYVTKAPDRPGYIVWFAWHSNKRGAFKSLHDDLMWIHAKEFVFFGAGSLGTTEILLRSKELGLSISDDLGTEMSGNGDMLGFGYNTDYDANCIAQSESPPGRPVGPCITSVLDMRDKKNPLEGFVVEDCAIPLALGAFMFPMMELLPDNEKPTYQAFQKASKYASRLGSKYLGAYYPKGSVARTPAYLIMSHDSSQGSLTLKGGKPVLTYSGVGRSASVNRIHSFLEQMTAAVGGDFIANPAWTLLGQQEITVHPIGGARVSCDGTGKSGVTNHLGEIFSGDGPETHSGLIVCDSSALPAAVGVNPLATITAFAERSVELVAKKRGIIIDYETKNGILNLFGRPERALPRDKSMTTLASAISRSHINSVTGIGFSEVMSGYIYPGHEITDFTVAANIARGRCQSARFFLTVTSFDASELLNNHLHPANLTGTFCSEALGGTFMVRRGTFQLFSQDMKEPDTANLVYNFDMVSPSGKKLHFYGYKVVNTAAYLNPLEVWRQTTTLFVTISEPDGTVAARGTLHIQPSDFYQELLTFQTVGPTAWSRLSATASFLTYFTKQVATPFFSTLGRLQWPTEESHTSFKVIPATATIPLTAVDGVETSMLMWEPLKKRDDGPAPVILFIPGAAVDHTMFALPTIEKNAISYFTEAGYQSYCLTHRVGRTPVARQGHTSFDTRRDIHAALSYIRKYNAARGDSQKIYVIAHCAGSLALSCGLLDGTIPASWISGITASMVFMNPKFGKVNHLVSMLPVDQVYSQLVGNFYDCTSSRNDTYFQQAVNQALRLYPSGPARESCRSVVCHRSQLVFGRLWTHKNLNEATHRHLDRFLGGTSMNSLAWLMRCGRLEQVTANGSQGANLVTPENIDRLQGIPILFLSGTGNMVFTAENTDTSYTTLCNAHGRSLYEREVFAGKGHLDAWMGSAAYKDVYPRVLRHVDKISQR